MTKRREFSKAQKAQMIQRASDEKGNILCEGCGLNVTGKRIEFDHTVPEALIIDKTRPLTIDDGKLLGAECCHGTKTAKEDIPRIAKTKRQYLKHNRLWPKSPHRIQSRGFPAGRNRAPLQG